MLALASVVKRNVLAFVNRKTIMTAPLLFDLRGKRVFVAGHRGMAGSAIVRRLADEGCEILTATREELDLCRQSDTEAALERMKPDAVMLAAGYVGGIFANNSFPADFIERNLAIGLNVISASHKAGVKKLLALGSSCIYPKFAPQPMVEESLLTGPLEPTNEWYSVAKIATIKLCEAYRKQYGADFISVMPTNLYGRGDNYHPQHSHVPAALIRRFHESKLEKLPTVTVWGTGKARREFLSSDDLADACVFLMKYYSDLSFVNVGTGKDITIAEFAAEVSDVVGYSGQITFDTLRPDGPPQKLLNVSKLTAMGWSPKTSLRDGLETAYADFKGGTGRSM